MEIKNVTRTRLKGLSTGVRDVVAADGMLLQDVPALEVLVTAETDLDLLPQEYPAGTLAYTAAFANIWMKNASGNWVEV